MNFCDQKILWKKPVNVPYVYVPYVYRPYNMAQRAPETYIFLTPLLAHGNVENSVIFQPIKPFRISTLSKGIKSKN